MLRALCEHLIEKPELFQSEMALFLWDEFEAQVTVYSIGRALASVGWSKKAARRIAKERNADLRDFYLYKLSFFRSYQLVYVDESGCVRRIGFRRTGWSPVGVTPVQISQFHREQGYQILPAYAQDGIVLARVFQGTTDAAVFEDFIEQLLPHCGRFPEPKSVIIMENASFRGRCTTTSLLWHAEKNNMKIENWTAENLILKNQYVRSVLALLQTI
jgi:hypothetical protein